MTALLAALIGLLGGIADWLLGRQQAAARMDERRAGADAVRAILAEERERVLDEQLQAMADRPADRDTVLERLRRGEF